MNRAWKKMQNIGFFVACVVLGLMAPSSTAWVAPYNYLYRYKEASRRKFQTKRLEIGPQQLGEFEPLCPSESKEERQVQLFDFASSGELVQFEDAWEFQKKLLEGHVERLAHQREKGPVSQFLCDRVEFASTGLDTVVMLQHNPVYTLGTGSDEEFIVSTSSENSVPVVRMDRGGEVYVKYCWYVRQDWFLAYKVIRVG
jgi:hypothetical protein